MTDLFADLANARAVDHEADDAETTTRSRHWTAVYRVRHDGREIGQTEQAAGSGDVAAQLLNPRLHKNEEIGTFPSHKEAEKAIVKERQRRSGEGG
jgi:hypothetical protein